VILAVTARLAAPVAHDDDIHLDGILCAAHPSMRVRQVARSTPEELLRIPELPIARVRASGAPCFLASAQIWPEDARADRETMVRRRDADDVEMLAHVPSRTSGPGKHYALPVPLTVAMSVSWRCVGSRRGVLELLRHVHALGKFRRHGYGAVAEWTVEPWDGGAEGVLFGGGCALRNLPAEWVSSAETCDVPTEPPYWHSARVRPGVRRGTCARPSAAASAALSRCR
jgi:CRISPR type IV-associated protein Csf3